MALIVENDSSDKKELLKAKRRERQSKVRQALLINEYVYTKYFTIYQEAALYYNQLNSLHPSKSDLRKCDEFKVWKKDTSGYPIRVTRRYHKVCHSNIPVEQHPELTVQADLSEQQHQLSVQAESPDLSEQQHQLSVQAESPDLSEQQLELSVQAESPDLSEQQLELSVQADLSEQHPELTVQADLSEQHPELTVQAESPDLSEQQLELSVQAESPDLSEQTANPGEKVMQLKIPLMTPSVVTETLQILTQETIQENPLQVAAEGITQETPTIHPSIQEELPQDIIDRIINELREDPELKTIMTDIEQDLEFEQVGMELDVSEDDRLEKEIENLMLW